MASARKWLGSLIPRSPVHFGSLPGVPVLGSPFQSVNHGVLPKGTAGSWIALLGRGQTSTDGIQDYCTYLGKALEKRGIVLKRWRMDWCRLGWRRALHQLRRESQSWKGRWALLQYTALAFSSRGFPLRAIEILRILHHNGVRCAVVFHDPVRQGGPRLRDRFRGAIQDWVIRRIFLLADVGIFLDPISSIRWLPKSSPKAVSIPLGANMPEPPLTSGSKPAKQHANKMLAVFCLSLDGVVSEELDDLFAASRAACDAGAKFRLVFLGRGTEESRDSIASRFRAIPVDVSILGILTPERVAEVLADADAMLCVRGRLYPRRGSAIAGIACGLPILAYGGTAEGTPLNEAGVLLVPYRNAAALGRELARVLRDPALAHELRCRSARAYQQHFSWSVIADAYIKALGGTNG